jgi:transposase
MPNSERRLGRTLKDLALALLNATLLLALACLVAGVVLVSRFQGVTDAFAQKLADLSPVRQELAALREEVGGLRTDLAAMATGASASQSSSLMRLQTRTALLDDKVQSIQSTVSGIAQDPFVLIDHAVGAAADELRKTLTGDAACPDRDTGG